MHLWRYPSLSIHGVEGAFDKPGAKTVIPGRVTGKFSIRLVPHMNLPVVERQVTNVRCSSAQRDPCEVPHNSLASNSVVGIEVPFPTSPPQYKRD